LKSKVQAGILLLIFGSNILAWAKEPAISSKGDETVKTQDIVSRGIEIFNSRLHTEDGEIMDAKAAWAAAVRELIFDIVPAQEVFNDLIDSGEAIFLSPCRADADGLTEAIEQILISGGAIFVHRVEEAIPNYYQLLDERERFASTRGLGREGEA
jgi:hypothetical protein